MLTLSYLLLIVYDHFISWNVLSLTEASAKTLPASEQVANGDPPTEEELWKEVNLWNSSFFMILANECFHKPEKWGK